MGHAENNFPATVHAGPADKRVEHGNDHFRTFNGKARLAQIFFVKELFKKGGLIKFFHNPEFIFGF